MSDHDDLLEKARELGRAIAASKVMQDLSAIEKRIEENLATRKLRDEHRELAMKLARLEMQKQPIEPEDKRKLQSLVDQLRQDPLFQELVRVQVEHQDLMRQVNEQISTQLKED